LRSTDSLWAAGVWAREDGAREAALEARPLEVTEEADGAMGADEEGGGLLDSKLSSGSFSTGEAFWGWFIASLAAAPWASVVPLLRRRLVRES
jgi:hypothetical protein